MFIESSTALLHRWRTQKPLQLASSLRLITHSVFYVPFKILPWHCCEPGSSRTLASTISLQQSLHRSVFVLEQSTKISHIDSSWNLTTTIELTLQHKASPNGQRPPLSHRNLHKRAISALPLAIPVYLLSITLFGRDVGEDKQSNFIVRVYQRRGRVNRNVIGGSLMWHAYLLQTVNWC